MGNLYVNGAESWSEPRHMVWAGLCAKPDGERLMHTPHLPPVEAPDLSRGGSQIKHHVFAE